MIKYNPCIIIPCYNHGKTVIHSIETIQKFNIFCILVNDGSDQETTELLEKLAAQKLPLYIHNKKQNTGKGGALITGMNIAASMGYTHCLQIDADGQHNIEDIPIMLKHSKGNPAALVCGQPLYDKSIPLGRYIARYITHFWVGVELLTFNPPDSMCGFRVYPLTKTLTVINKIRIGQRMDFDTEILVRLLWEKAPLILVKTKVKYFAEGLSNFHYIKDNVLISIMHTRLVILMLFRLPLTIFNKVSVKPHWSKISERGSEMGIKILLWVYQKLGRGVLEFLLFFVIGYFFITNKASRQASLDFLNKAYQADSKHKALQKMPSLKTAFAHFIQFGRAALDKVASWTGDIKREDLNFPNTNQFDSLITKGTGGIIIASHLGNIEVCRALADGKEGQYLTVLIFTEHAQKFNRVVKNINPNFINRVIHVNHIGADTAILLKQRVEAGEIIVIVGDRTAVNSDKRTQQIDFMGYPAPFSEGAFILASLMECPVYLMFCLIENKRYKVYFEHFADQIKLPRKTRHIEIRKVMTKYVKRLEYYALKYPLQWYNFYDFWAEHQTNKEHKK